MKKIQILFLLLCLCYSGEAQPFQKNSHIITGSVSLDFVTLSSALSDTVWYSTIMPSYRLGYHYNFITNKKNYHTLQFHVQYFESNTFTLNAVVLDPGEMRTFQVSIHAEYLRYLPFTSFFSFVTGCSVTPDYYYFGQVISTDQVRILQDYSLNLGPEAGFSLYKTGFLEVLSVILLEGGIPVYSDLVYPYDFYKEMTGYSIAGTVKTRIQVLLGMFLVSLDYNYRIKTSLYLEKNKKDFVTDVYTISTTQSVFLNIGVRL